MAGLGCRPRLAEQPLAGVGPLLPIAFDIAWLVWGLTAASILLQVAVDLLDAATRGAAWVAALRQVTNWLVLPPIRRAVDASLGGLLLARVLVQPATVVEASGVATMGIVVPAPADARPMAAPMVVRASGAARSQTEPPAPAMDDRTPVSSSTDVVVTYTVQRGDTLWGIGGRFFGDPARGAEIIFEANQGRRQADGRVFDRRGLIFENWELGIPGPTRGIERAPDGTWWYTVQRDDTLAGEPLPASASAVHRPLARWAGHHLLVGARERRRRPHAARVLSRQWRELSQRLAELH